MFQLPREDSRSKQNLRNSFSPWYAGTAVCCSSDTCCMLVYWHIGLSRDLWKDDELIWLEFYPHYQAMVAIHSYEGAFSVSFIVWEVIFLVS